MVRQMRNNRSMSCMLQVDIDENAKEHKATSLQIAITLDKKQWLGNIIAI